MHAFSFFIRTMVYTFLFVMLLQVHWGEHTIEDHTMNFLTTSAMIKPIEGTANSAVVFIRNMWSKATSTINTNFANALRSENQPGSRHNKFSLERSEKYVAKKAEEAEVKAKDFAHKVKSKFIDETATPGQADSSAASATHDEE